jgi:hypothetical protein
VIPALIAVACFAAYLITGWRIALARRAVFWAKARKAWTLHDLITSSVRWQFIGMVLLWSIWLPMQALSRSIDGTVTAADPVELASKAAERERRIADLEAENERLRRRQPA